MTILLIMVEEFSENIKKDVWSLAAEPDLSRCLSEDSDIRTQRETSQRKAERLKKAAEELRQF